MSSRYTSLVQIGLSGVSKLGFFFVNVLLYKALSLTEVGFFSLIYAIAVILATISECGLRGLLVREMARSHESPEQLKRLLAGALKSRLLTLLPYAVAGSLAGIIFLPATHLMPLGLLLAAAWLDSNAMVFRGALRAFNLIVLDAALAGIFRTLLLIGTGLLFWQQQLSLYNFALLFLIIAMMDILITMGLVSKKTGVRLSINSSIQQTTLLVKRGIPFIILNIIGIIYIRVGILLLGLSPAETAMHEVAAFNLSSKIPEGVSFLPIALMNAAIPFFARNSGQPEKVIPIFRKLELVMGSAGIMISLGLVFFAEQLIPLLATKEYSSYTTVFRLYGVTTFFTFLQYVYANLLLCMDQEHAVARRYGYVLALNVVLNLALIWKFGALGAVIALLVCEVSAVGIDMRFLLRAGIAPAGSLIIKWGGIILVSIVLGWCGTLLPQPYGMVLYWIVCGLIGAILLARAQLSRTTGAK